jgi:hypothetical protein
VRRWRHPPYHPFLFLIASAGCSRKLRPRPGHGCLPVRNHIISVVGSTRGDPGKNRTANQRPTSSLRRTRACLTELGRPGRVAVVQPPPQLNHQLFLSVADMVVMRRPSRNEEKRPQHSPANRTVDDARNSDPAPRTVHSMRVRVVSDSFLSR